MKARSGCPLLLCLKFLLQLLTAAESAVVSFEPPIVHDLTEQKNRSVEVTVNVPVHEYHDLSSTGDWKIALESLDKDIVSVSDFEPVEKDALLLSNDTLYYTNKRTFTICGNFLGKSGVRARFVDANWTDGPSTLYYQESPSSHVTLDIWVKRSADSVWLTKVFVSTLIVIISLANVMMGCELNLNIVLETVRRPVAPLIGFCTQFVAMPLLAYYIGTVLFAQSGMHSFALGLFVTGCAPGGGASNFWTVLLGGNVNLSVTMTFLSTVASCVMIPLWMMVLGHEFLQGGFASSRLRVPYSKILSSLASLVIPLLIGVAIAKYKPNVAAKLRKIMRPFIIFVLIFVVVFGCLANTYMWHLMTGRALLGGLLLPWCGFACGCFAALLSKRSPPDVTAIAIETGIQNTGIAILMLKWSFPEPDADISALMPVIVACFTPGPLLLGAAVHLIVTRWRKRREANAVEQPAPKQAEEQIDAAVGESTEGLEAKCPLRPLVENAARRLSTEDGEKKHLAESSSSLSQMA